jgi:ankyrin repeat protein
MESQKKMIEPSKNEDLRNAVRRGENGTVRELLDSNGFDEYIKQNGGKLLLGCPSLEIAELLILKGASVNTVFEDGETLLNKVASLGDAKMVNFLMCYGATTWNRCPGGRKFFKRLFANSLLDPLLSGMFKSFSRPN